MVDDRKPVKGQKLFKPMCQAPATSNCSKNVPKYYAYGKVWMSKVMDYMSTYELAFFLML